MHSKEWPLLQFMHSIQIFAAYQTLPLTVEKPTTTHTYVVVFYCHLSSFIVFCVGGSQTKLVLYYVINAKCAV